MKIEYGSKESPIPIADFLLMMIGCAPGEHIY